MSLSLPLKRLRTMTQRRLPAFATTVKMEESTMETPGIAINGLNVSRNISGRSEYISSNIAGATSGLNKATRSVNPIVMQNNTVSNFIPGN